MDTCSVQIYEVQYITYIILCYISVHLVKEEKSHIRYSLYYVATDSEATG